VDLFSPPENRRPPILFYGVLAAFTAVLVAYSQTLAYTGDEGFHLLAAQLIRHGMRPYLDFCFPQTPLNAYWNAGWMSVFGESWRVPHAAAALLTAGAVWLIADFVFARIPVAAGWRTACALAAGLLAGLNAQVFGFGTIGQAYGLCLFLIAAAFRCSVRAADRGSWRWSAAAGLCASAAAASSMLAAPAPVVLLLWLAVYGGARGRWTRLAAFCAAAVIPWLPVVWLFAQGPRQTWFNVVEYHAKYRKLYWPETTQHDLEIMTSWIDSGQALLLGFLAIAGLAFVRSRRDWPGQVKASLYLSAWLALTICAALGFAHPTFARYYLLSTPFFAVLAAVGLWALAPRLGARGPALPVAIVIVLTCGGLLKFLYERRENYTWPDYEKVARKIEAVTPPNGVIFANEITYFLMKRRPVPGLEFYYDRLVPLPPAQLALLHIMPQAELDRRLAAGAFDTVYICEDDDQIAKLGLAKLYRKREELEECSLFSDKK
jgi:hypothetical protein